MDHRWTLALSTLAFVACTEEPREEDQAAPNTSLSASAEGTAGAESSTTMEMDDDDDIKLDLGEDTDDPNTGVDPDGDDESGCDKVDFLFVIDNSGSMGEFQDNLVANFPGFIDTIQGTLDEAQDYHIMVVDTDPTPPIDCPALCEQAATDGCLDAANTCPLINPDPMGNPFCTFTCATMLECSTTPGACNAPVEPEACEIMGAGVTYPRGSDASNIDCNFSSGQRYMDATEPDLHAAFSCAAKVGTAASGASEQPMGAMVRAVTPTEPAFACNEGFIRDDAILVVTFITDEDDDAGDGSDGEVVGWRSALVTAKGGNEDAVVVLGLFGGGGCGEDSLRLTQFVDSWEDRGLQGSVCGDYQGFFQQAVDLIDTTCDEFVPPTPAG
jgi:hypothetical protein